MPLKPDAAPAPEASRQSKLIVPPYPREAPRRRVAEAFAGIETPGAGAPANLARRELFLTSFRAPSQLASCVQIQLASQSHLPIAPNYVREPHPCEMKNLVNQNPLEIAPFFQNLLIQQDQPLGNRSRGQMRPQGFPEFYADLSAAEGRKHDRGAGPCPAKLIPA